jgi:hypothetical protein
MGELICPCSGGEKRVPEALACILPRFDTPRTFEIFGHFVEPVAGNITPKCVIVLKCIMNADDFPEYRLNTARSSGTGESSYKNASDVGDCT